MATTKQFQSLPDFYTDKSKCLEAERKRENTNPRYKEFIQTHFTAGDIEQFERYRDPTNGSVCIPNIDLENNVWKQYVFVDFYEKYRNISVEAITNTFNYLFHKFKKGIFIKIKNGELGVFLPFSKKNFVNEWHRQIRINPKYGDLQGFIKYIQTEEGRRFNPRSVNKFIDGWYSNNCLLRYEFPISEGDSNNTNMSDMFRTLCAERKIPDLELFVNRRDFPLLKRNGTEPYNHIFDSDNVPLVSHNYSQYCPILSMVSNSDFADIAIPTGDDWARVSYKEGKYFTRFCKRDFTVNPTPWNERKSVAVFRGSSTGHGTTMDTNPRLKLAYLSSLGEIDDDGLPFLDAGITSWNLRPRKICGEKYLQTIEIEKLPFGLITPLTPQEQTNYKYAINVDGHVCAYRLSLELESNTCILLVNSKYKLWYRDMLKPFVHYVPIKEDLSDLIEKIKWCKENDEQCSTIAKNARKFALKYLTKNGILDYLQNLLIKLKQTTGVYLYNSISLTDLQTKCEMDILKENEIESVASYEAIERMVRMHSSEIKIIRELFNNKTTTISLCDINGYKIVKKNNSIHECFVAQYGTNKLSKKIPNFVYAFGDTYMEYIEGENLFSYIQSEQFELKQYFYILIQLSLAIHIAQQDCDFVHYDLTPWNIILRKLPQKTTIQYILPNRKICVIETDLIPVIIDMGRSHIVYKRIHYGIINRFMMSTVQDILTLILTSIYEITNRQDLREKDINNLITLANFLSGTDYRERKFKYTGKNGLGDLRFFIRSAKKYTEILYRNKGNLENKTPLDLFNYILNELPNNYDLRIVEDNYMVGLTTRQIDDYNMASTVEDRLKSFTQVFKQVKKISLPNDKQLVKKFIEQVLYELKDVKDRMVIYLNSIDKDVQPYVEKYDKIVNRINKKYMPKILTFDENIFYHPEKVLELLEQCVNYDTTSLQYIASLLYKSNVKTLLQTKMEGDCKTAKEYLKLYRKVISYNK